MEKKNLSVILIYSSLFGLVATFFSFLLTPIQTTASLDSFYNVSTNEATLITLCFNGTIKGGAFIVVMLLLVLILALVVDIILTIRLTRGDDIPKGLYILTIIYGGVTAILAIICIAVFVSTFNGQFASVSSSSESATVSSGGDLCYAYLFLIEAAGTAIIAGILGLQDSSSYVVRKYRPSSSSSYTRVSTGPGSSAPRTSYSSEALFNVGDTVELTVENYAPFVPVGTVCVVTRVVSDKIIYVKKTGNNDSQEFSVFTHKVELVKSKNEQTQQAKPSSPRPAPNNSETDNIQKIKEYKKLLDEGIITQEEFDKKKKELLDL